MNRQSHRRSRASSVESGARAVCPPALAPAAAASGAAGAQEAESAASREGCQPPRSRRRPLPGEAEAPPGGAAPPALLPE
jgi:hypothetical protein